jgi:hypothetical protein
MLQNQFRNSIEADDGLTLESIGVSIVEETQEHPSLTSCKFFMLFSSQLSDSSSFCAEHFGSLKQ